MTYRDIPEIEQRYKSSRWVKLRKQKLLLNPFCERCLEKGIYNPTKIIHHIEYITDKNYMLDEVFFNLDNLESLCQPCHNEEHFKEEQEYIFDDEGNLVRKR